LQPVEPRSGSIYDLGYRNYTGARLGRRHAVASLYWYTLRGAFGIGRRTSSKIIPMLVTVFAFLPALIQLGVAAVLSDDVEVFRPDDYFGFVQVPVALFCAAVAPEITGRDQRQRTLALYFSRALRRRDYAIAKLAAFSTALLFLTLLPQAVLVLGNGFAANDLWGYISDEWTDLPRTLVIGVMIAATAGTMSLAIAAQTGRRAYATVAVVGWFLITWPIAGILAIEVGGAGRFAVYASPFDFIYGAALWIFDVAPGTDSTQYAADFPAWTYPLTMVVYMLAGAALVIRRFDRISA